MESNNGGKQRRRNTDHDVASNKEIEGFSAKVICSVESSFPITCCIISDNLLELTGPVANPFPPEMILFPPIGTRDTLLVSPG